MSYINDVLNGRYKTRSQLEEEQKIKQQQRQEKLANFENKSKTLGTVVKQKKDQNTVVPISTNIKLNKKQQKELTDTKNLTNMLIKKQENEALNKIYNPLNTGDLYINKDVKQNLINGKPIAPMLDKQMKQTAVDVGAPIVNAGLGAIQGAQNVGNYLNAFGKKMLTTAGSTALDKLIGNKEVSNAVSDVLVNRGLEQNPTVQKYNKDREDITNLIAKNIERTNNPVSKKLAELTPSIGSNLVSGAVTAVNPLTGTALFMTSAGGSYLDEAKQRGMNDDQALGYATIMGLVEGGTEALITGKMASRLLKATTGKELGKAYLQSLKNDLLENFLQESATEWISEGTAKAFGGQSNWGDFQKIAKDSLQSGIDGVLSALIMQGAFSGVSSAQNVYNKLTNNQNITEREILTALDDFKKANPEAYKQTATGATEALIEQSKQTIPSEIKTAQNEISEEISNKQKQEVNLNDVAWLDSLQGQYAKVDNLANNLETLYNNTKLGEINNIPIDDVLQIQNRMGHRTEEQINSLREYVKQNGLQNNPIELVKHNNGKIEIEDGNHRLLIAKELGLKEVPVRFVESWENIGRNVNTTKQQELERWNEKNGIRDNGENNGFNDTNRNIERSRFSSSNEFGDRRGTEGNDRIFREESNSNEYTNDNGTRQNIKKTQEIKNSNQSSFSVPYSKNARTMQDVGLPVQNNTQNSEQINYDVEEDNNVIPIEEGKQRRHYKNIANSDQVTKETRQMAKNLYNTETYTPISNYETITKANQNIQRNGSDRTYEAFMNKASSNERITLQDIATGERLIQIYSQAGDYNKVNELVQTVAMLGTELGQQVQAFSLIQRASPEGQLQYLQRLVDRTNIKENTDIKVTDEMAEKILKSKNQEELQNNISEVAIELADELPLKWNDKLRSWRYLSMLGNPRTHIRNLVANIGMGAVQNIKNKVAGLSEDIAGKFVDFEKTKTLKPANKDQKAFAKQDANVMKDLIDGGGKYDIKNVIQSSKKQFNNKLLNAIAEFNTNLLDKEDKIFLKSAYKRAIQNYMSANNLSSSDMEGETLQKARQYASIQAQEATFHQFNSVANALANFENKNIVTKLATSATVPFKKTPMNIAKTGFEYSPLNIANSVGGAIYDITSQTNKLKQQLQKGNISQKEYKTATSQMVTKRIDQMAKGLTGTSIAMLGYMLASQGIIKAGSDGKDEEFEEKLGKQTYSITIGDDTYTLDWLSPSAIPLFLGATLSQMVHSNEEKDKGINALMTSVSQALEPMTEMSMLQGLTNAISSYESGSSMFTDLGASMAQSYLGQYIPTALGQVTKTIDPNIRDTSSTAKGFEKKAEQFINQTKAKIPGLSYTLPTKTDIWGNERIREGNIVERYFNNAIAPYNKEKIKTDKVSDELLKVYNETGEASVLPTTVNKDLTINKEKYTMTAEELAKYKKHYGQTSYKLLKNLTTSKDYKKLTNEQKQTAIDNIYKYSKEAVKVDYAKKHNLNYEESTMYNVASKLSENNRNNYFAYTAKIKDMDKQKEKIQALADTSYLNTVKETIYENSLGKDDSLYDIMKKSGIDMTEYLKYKTQDFESDKKDDGTVNGKVISGSKKHKVYDYVEKMKIDSNQKLLLLGTQFALSNQEKQTLAQYVNNLKITSKEKLDIYGKLKGFTVYKDGRVTW